MPIRINLLAEARALEELRRRDPVKRLTYLGVGVVCVVAAFSTWLQLQVLITSRELTKVQAQITSRSTEFQQVLQNQKNLADVNHRLGALQELATNRLLYGTLLNALQQTTIDDVQLTRMRAEQSFALTEATKPKDTGDKHFPGKPARVTEKIVLTLDARDSGANPGDQVNKFKQALGDSPYFQVNLGKTNDVRLTSLSPPQAIDGRPFVQFTLECRYPERTR